MTRLGALGCFACARLLAACGSGSADVDGSDGGSVVLNTTANGTLTAADHFTVPPGGALAGQVVAGDSWTVTLAPATYLVRLCPTTAGAAFNPYLEAYRSGALIALAASSDAGTFTSPGERLLVTDQTAVYTLVARNADASGNPIAAAPTGAATGSAPGAYQLRIEPIAGALPIVSCPIM